MELSGLLSPINLALEFSVAILIVSVIIRTLKWCPGDAIPTLPMVGMLPSLFIALQHDIYKVINYLLRDHNGTFVFTGPWFTSLKYVITSNPTNLEYIVKTNFSNFPKGKYFSNNVRDLLGEGIFNADDVAWLRQRKTASIVFHSTEFVNMNCESLVKLVHHRMLPILEGSAKDIDLQDLLLRLTFDNVCMIAFGVDTCSLKVGLPEIPFVKAFEDATEAMLLRFITPTLLWRTMRFLNLGRERHLKRCIGQVDEFAEGVILTRKKELSLNSSEKKSRSDLLTAFMGLKDEGGKPYSDKYLRDICVNFILAGRDTSSVALSWFFWVLDENPIVQEKIFSELCRIVDQRKENDSDKGSEDVDVVFKPEEVKRMEYLHAALSESLRLYPTLPLDFKEVLEDDVFPDGTVLKKGTKVIYSIYTMGRMKSIWGEDCRHYKPERWLKDGRFVSESTQKFMAFNGGQRICLGKDFAYYQMKFIAASIIYRYRVQVAKDQIVAPKFALTMYIKHGLKVRLNKREKSEFQK
ncbi:hypothetical protein GIB67_020751 [Kingdonia uniflora]|uniref:Cytochrome P450 n=1 Tax=Kingdonia uniflora TaxID=39325 RepID=A0A7J7M7E3_9MAGN|nr:hypothetical protein GIB67_020751 [Kingdonia uniflora]